MEGRDTAKIIFNFKDNLNIDEEDNKSTISEPKTKLSSYKKDFTDLVDEKRKKYSNTFIHKPYYLNPNLFQVFQSGKSDQTQKVKSYITILSIWNMMMGSGIITLPYSVYQAGIIPTLIICILYGFVCFYTCRVVVKTGGKDEDYSDTVYRYFRVFGEMSGNTGKYMQIIFNLSINIGASFVYFLIINQNLYPCLVELLKAFGIKDLDPKELTPDFSHFSIIYCGIIIIIIVFPLLLLKDLSILIKINSYGIYIILTILSFIIFRGIYGISTTDFKFDYFKNEDDSKTRYLYLFGENPCLLMGTCSLGFFAHSIIMPIMKNNEKQENNTRDLAFGYLLVVLTYIILGISGYFGFSAKDMPGNFEDNWFRMFDSNLVYIIALRIINVIQILSVFPVLVYIVRIQFFGIFFNISWPGYKYLLIYINIYLGMCFFILYFFYNKLGKFVGYLGAITALFLIFIIPSVVNMIYYKRKHPFNLEELQKQLNDAEKDDKEFNYDKDYFGISKKKKNNFKEILFYISQILIICMGLMTVFVQIKPINIFNIHLKNQEKKFVY